MDAPQLADGSPTPERELERAETRRELWEALRRLSPADRELLVLREFQDLSYAEIAAILDVPRGTVMSRLHRARLRLRSKLEALGGGAGHG